MGFGTFEHSAFGDELIQNDHMCFIEGVPGIWDEDRYLMGVDGVMKRMVDCFRNISRKQRNEVLEYLKLTAPHEDMGDSNLIAFNNGVLDIGTMEMNPNTPDLFIPNTIPHNYNPEAHSQALDDALSTWACGDPAIRQNLEEAFGLAMYRSRTIPSCPVLIGEGGNGKSVYLNFLRQMLGEPNVSALDLQHIGERFAGSALMAKLANIGDDIPSDTVRPDKWSVAKKAISGDVIRAENKYGPTFSFRPYCLFLFACNKFPGITDTSNGMQRRLVPIPFNASFGMGTGKCNILIAEQLNNEETFEYAIRLGIDALKVCINQGGMTCDHRQVEMKEELIIENSPVYDFCRDQLYFGTPDQVSIEGTPTGILYNSYRAYCQGRKQRPIAHNQFTVEMCRLYKVSHGRATIEGEQVAAFLEG